MNNFTTDNYDVMVIREAIQNKEALRDLSIKDLNVILDKVISNLTPSEVRNFIYRCVSNRDFIKAYAMADRAIEYALEMKTQEGNKSHEDLISASIGTLSILSGSNPALKDKITELLDHNNPQVVIAVIENLGHTSNLENFNRVSNLLVHSSPIISLAAANYIEACTRDAAFRKRSDLYVIEDASEEFLRKALLRLESVYKQIKHSEGSQIEVSKRISVLVAMMYNEILDSMDWKRSRQEDVDERIYYALEQYLREHVGPDSLPYIEKTLINPNIENGIKRSALHTISRMGKQEPMRQSIILFLANYISTERSPDLVFLADSIEKTLSAGKEFSILSFLSNTNLSVSSIVPRAAGAPLKRPEPTNLDDL